MPPCKGCPNRTAIPNCHSACEQYLAYDAERQMIREKRRLDNEGLDAMISKGALAKARLAQQKRQKQKG